MQQLSQEQTDWAAVTRDHKIAKLGFDSLAILDLIYDIQQEFDIQFDPEEMADVRTVGQLEEFLEKCLGEKT